MSAEGGIWLISLGLLSGLICNGRRKCVQATQAGGFSLWSLGCGEDEPMDGISRAPGGPADIGLGAVILGLDQQREDRRGEGCWDIDSEGMAAPIIFRGQRGRQVAVTISAKTIDRTVMVLSNEAVASTSGTIEDGTDYRPRGRRLVPPVPFESSVCLRD